MGVMTSYAPGQFCWVDLMAHDLPGARAFYTGLFGWEAAEQETGGPPYVLFRKDGHDVAGLGQMPPEMRQANLPSIWNSYINVEDLAAACEKVTQLGGQVTMPAMQVLQAGYMAGIQDPTGAYVFLWQKNRHIGAGLINRPGSWVWNELMTHDPAAAQAFYSALFGWEFTEDEHGAGQYWFFSNAGRRNGGLMRIPPEMGGAPPFWAVYFAVADVQEACGNLTKRGGRVMRPPIEFPVGTLAVVADDQGAAFNLIQLSIPPDE